MDDLDFGATLKGFNPGQKVLQRYTLKKILGRGGMGVVWLAHDEELERDVALKFLPEVVVLDKEAVRDLKRETRRSLELTHSHIVRIYDFIQDARTAAISMEYIAGETLAARKVDHPAGHFETAELETWMRQLLEALAYAHTKGEVVHRDLKPANLMIDARGDLKIADFGIAASVSDSVSRVSAQAGSSGTPVYMSPQQMMGEKPAVTDDIYAFGATLYELLTGKPPFHSGNVMMQVQNKVPPAMTARREELGMAGAPIPAAWEDTVAACLAKEPSDRPQGAREVARRLGLSAGVTAAPFPVKPAPAKTVPMVERLDPKTLPPAKDNALGATRSTKIPLYAGLAATVLVLAGAGYYFGVYAPEQKRLAEMKRLQDEGRAVEAAQLRNEKEKADAAAKEKADTEQQAYSIMVAKIDSLLDASPANQREATGKAVADYQATVPARFRADIEGRWTKRLAGWDAHRLSLARGGFRIRTRPDGAEVQVGSLALEKSPLVKNDVRLGKYPVTIRAEGYDDWRGEVEVKENDFSDPGVIALVRSMGQLELKSDPAGAQFTMQQRGGETVAKSGTSPATLAGLPTGSYALTARFPGLADLTREVEVTRNGTTPVELKFAYGAVQVTSNPVGAEVWANQTLLGKTPLTLNNFAAGNVALEVRTKGYARQKTGGRLDPGRTLALAATLKKGGYDDPVTLAESALEEMEKETDPTIRASLLVMLGYWLSQLDGVPPDTLRAIGDRQLEAARRISDPLLQLRTLAEALEFAAGIDLDYSRQWAEAMVPMMRRITSKEDRQSASSYAGMLWMHPSLAAQATTAMNDWFAGNDTEWAYVSMVAGMHKRFGNEADARALAARAQGPYRADSIKGNLQAGEDDRRADPISLSLLRKDFAGAKRQMAGLSTLSYGTVARMAGVYLQQGDPESARQLGSLVDKTMAPYFPTLLITMAIAHNNPAFAEKMAATLSDTADASPRSDAYRDLTAYYAKLGWKDKARAAAAQITNFGNLEYGLGRQQAVPVLMAVGEETRARRLAQAVTVAYTKDKAYLAGYNATMFLSIGDNEAYNRCLRLYTENNTPALVAMFYGAQLIPALSTQGRLDEAEKLLDKVGDTIWWSNAAQQLGQARARMVKEDDYDALLENARPGRARAVIYNGILALKVEKKMLARAGH